MTIREKIQGWLDETQELMVQKYNDLGLRASGDWEKGLSGKISESGSKYTATIEGNHYTWYMEHGRGTNKKQDKESIRKFLGWAGNTFIKDWVRQKGLIANPFAVAYKIATRGIQVPNRYNSGGIVSDIITNDRLKKLYDSMGSVMIEKIKSDILKTFK
jgi:hypothetical protein